MRFRKTDRRALLLMASVATVALFAGVLLERYGLSERNVTSWERIEADSLDAKVELRHTRHASNATGEASSIIYDDMPVHTPETFPFDPNTADSTTLLRLGLSPWQVRSVYRYRAKGGRYHRKEDFKRVPGMTPEVWERLAKVMTIGEAYQYYHEQKDTTRQVGGERVQRDSLPYPQQEKYQEVVQLDINTVDSNALKMIPGIASVRARRILRYRDELGGFVSLDQLSEIEGLPEGIEQWFKVETGILRPLRINTLRVGALSRHPYVSFQQARDIDQYRRRKGKIRDLRELRLIESFTEADFQRLEPYVQYE